MTPTITVTRSGRGRPKAGAPRISPAPTQVKVARVPIDRSEYEIEPTEEGYAKALAFCYAAEADVNMRQIIREQARLHKLNASSLKSRYQKKRGSARGLR
jgi:hypothetical protein